MDTRTVSANLPPRQVRPACCECDPCTSGMRNNYFPGKKITTDVFRVEQTYLAERRQLINRAMFGWGVVYGFGVAMEGPDPKCPGSEQGTLAIGEGLALDRLGRELVQTRAATITLDNILVLDEQGGILRQPGQQPRDAPQTQLDTGACWLLKVHYAEQLIGPVTMKDSCSCDRTEWNQVCETVRYTLQRIDCGDCCVEDECGLNCECATSPCCGEAQLSPEVQKQIDALQAKIDQARTAGDLATAEELQVELQALLSRHPTPETVHGRGGCRCLCDHLTHLQLGADCTALTQIDKCARADLHNGIALACLKIEADDCEGWRFATVYDDCGPRRLVKRNDLLFDLIRGCDVTRISEIGWAQWHRSEQPVPFEAFAAALGPAPSDNDQERVTRDFWLRFSHPVRAATLRPDCFAMTVIDTEVEGGWWQEYRVPIIRIDTTLDDSKGDPPGYVRSARVVVDGDWLGDAIYGRETIFFKGETRVEIAVRGDFIVDCNGQTVDANARGLLPYPTGSDGPGDTFLSTFIVGERQKPQRQPKQDSSSRGATQ